MSVTVDPVAIKKAVMHSCKYPSKDVLGLLVGTSSGSTYKVTNAYPVTHSRITGISTQFSFDVVPKVMKSDEKVIGVYECTVSDEDVSPSAEHLSNALREYFGIDKNLHLNVVFSVDGSDELPSEPTMQNCMAKDLEKTANISLTTLELANSNRTKLTSEAVDKSQFKDLLSPKSIVQLQDVDSHLENPSLDFRNTWVN